MSKKHEPVKTGQWILRGKLRPPLCHLSLVDRPNLISSLDELLNYQASIVVAPAGYGKTTLLTQWREHLAGGGIKAGWFSLDGQDDDPYRFLCYTVFALTEAGIDLGQLEMLAEQGLSEMPLEAALVTFLAAIESADKRIVLILDDYHRLTSEAIDRLLDKLIENAPGNFHLIVSSRQRPHFSVAHLCATGLGIEIDAETLRFSDEEMHEVLSGIDDPQLVERLKTSTEGWPVAVQLARLAYGQGQRQVGTLAPAMGPEGHIAAFLSEQVFQGLGDELQLFLTRTAILDQFNPELANAVYEGNASWRLLKELGDLGSLIVSLDEEGDWRRYHHLFAEYLLNQLREREPDRIAQLHGNASLWFEQDGDTQQAVRHAALADDLARAARLIETGGGWELILFGGIGYLRNLLNLIPEQRLTHFPRLEIAKSYLLIKTGDIAAARTYYDQACAQYQSKAENVLSPAAFERDALNIGAMLSVYEDEEIPVERLRTQGLQTFPNGDPDSLTNGMLACRRVAQEIYFGQFDAARNTVRDAMHHMRQSGSVLGLNYCYIHAAVSDFHQCNINQALANAHESSALAADNFGSDSGLKSLSDVILVSLLFWTNQLTEEQWQGFESAFDYVSRYDGWFEIYALALETQVQRHLLHGDIDNAAASIHRVRRLAQSRSMERLERHIESMELLLALEQGNRQRQNAIARRLAEQLPAGCWRDRLFYWRNYVHGALALVEHHTGANQDRAERYARDAIECCRQLDAKFLLVRALCTYASLLDKRCRRAQALDVLSEALSIAEPQGISVAIAYVRSALPLLRHAQSRWRAEARDTATVRFVAAVINVIRSVSMQGGDTKTAASLSPRETEVLTELSLGLSNKEIARALDMTEHTVKFHLKNIFTKLSINRRTEALIVAREQGLV